MEPFSPNQFSLSRTEREKSCGERTTPYPMYPSAPTPSHRSTSSPFPLNPPKTPVVPYQITLSAAQAAEASKNSSLYKSAGGALSSLLNQFVDESYYRSPETTPSSQTATSSGGERKQSLACGVSALGNALSGSEGAIVSLTALGLGRTGMTDRDAGRLAAVLRARRVDSPLEEVEVRVGGG